MARKKPKTAQHEPVMEKKILAFQIDVNHYPEVALYKVNLM
jgi:hypothetical protein